MKLFIIILLSFAVMPAGAQQASTAAAAAPDSVQELAGALMRAGAISQPDWWKIMQLRGTELKAVPAENIRPPAVPTPPITPPPAAQISSQPVQCVVQAAPAAPAAPKNLPKVSGLAWFRYTYADAAPKAMENNSFGLPVARVVIAGDLPGSFKYSATLAFERLPSTSTQNSALYLWTLTYAPRAEFSLTMGQFTVPASADLLTPTSQIDFAARYYAQDRILNASFNTDQGLNVSGKLFGERLFYIAAVTNGKGGNYTSNDNENFLYSGRLAWTAYKGKLYGRDSSLVMGMSGMTETTRADYSTLRTADMAGVVFTRNYKRSVYGGDLQFKTGPATLKGEYMAAKLDGRGSDPEVKAYGWFTTAAYRLPGEKVELLVRKQGYDPDTRHRSAKDIKWTTWGLNWFINGYTTRALLNYTVKHEEKASTPNNELLAQLQFSF